MQNLGKIIILLFITHTLYGSKGDFKFQMFSDKKSAYVGESIKITFKFQYKLDKNIAEADFHPPRFRNFWIKPSKKVPNTIKNGYMIYKLDYIISPQLEGNQTIEPARMDIGILLKKQKNMLRLERVKYKTIFSNALKIKVKPLPKGITLFGQYQIKATVDKNKIKANQPINLKISVQGVGNIEDINDFDLNVKDALVYKDKAKHTIHFNHGKSEGEMQQKFAIVSDKNFTIPSVSLTFFNNKTKKIQTIQTKPINITVNGSSKQTFQTLQKSHESQFSNQKNSSLNKFYILGAFVFGSLLTLLIQKSSIFFSTQKPTSTQQKILKAKSDKELLSALLPYTNKSEDINKMVKKLEENIYENNKHKIDRKKLAKNFQTYVTIRKDDANILI